MLQITAFLEAEPQFIRFLIWNQVLHFPGIYISISWGISNWSKEFFAWLKYAKE